MQILMIVCFVVLAAAGFAEAGGDELVAARAISPYLPSSLQSALAATCPAINNDPSKLALAGAISRVEVRRSAGLDFERRGTLFEDFNMDGMLEPVLFDTNRIRGRMGGVLVNPAASEQVGTGPMSVSFRVTAKTGLTFGSCARCLSRAALF